MKKSDITKGSTDFSSTGGNVHIDNTTVRALRSETEKIRSSKHIAHKHKHIHTHAEAGSNKE